MAVVVAAAVAAVLGAPAPAPSASRALHPPPPATHAAAEPAVFAKLYRLVEIATRLELLAAHPEHYAACVRVWRAVEIGIFVIIL